MSQPLRAKKDFALQITSQIKESIDMGNSKIRRMCIDGMLIAVFIVLAKFTIKVPPLHISFASIAVVFATCYFGLADGFIVAFLGEVVIQMTSSYGIGPTTPLWFWSPAFRAIVIGLFDLPFRKKQDHIDLHPVVFGLVSFLAAITVTLTNAGVEVLDGLIIGYDPKVTLILVFGRILSSLVTSLVITLLSMPLLRAIRKAHGESRLPSQNE